MGELLIIGISVLGIIYGREIINGVIKISNKKNPKLEKKIEELESQLQKVMKKDDRLNQLESQNLQIINQISDLEDKQSFLNRLIEDKSN